MIEPKKLEVIRGELKKVVNDNCVVIRVVPEDEKVAPYNEKVKYDLAARAYSFETEVPDILFVKDNVLVAESLAPESVRNPQNADHRLQRKVYLALINQKINFGFRNG